MSQPASRWDGDIGARVICKKQILQTWTRLLLKPPPLCHRHEHRRIGTSLCNNLGTFSKTRFQEFAETGFGVLDRPATHEGSPDLVR
ncbi:MAG: hypothetical protein QOG66_3506 [Methylobacteriaceae bacterium]|jgi:hypothetical protein|nr:hypothetical protein [Methylobacteriaceae bacterium]